MPVRQSLHHSRPYERERRRGRLYSLLLHLVFLLLTIVGLPSFLSPPPLEEPPSISVEILPISAISNVKPSEAPPTSEVKSPDKQPNDTKPEPKAPEAKKAAPPVKTTEAAPPPPPAQKEAEKPKEKPAEQKKEPKPEPKKEEKKPTPKPKQDDLSAILKAVKETAQKEAKKEKKEDKKPDAPADTAKDQNQNKTVSSKYNADLPMSMSERDLIMSQLAKCWSVPAGAKDAQNLVVVIDAEYNSDGSYIKVALSSDSQARYNSDTFFRAAADSALRAVKECSPLKNLPPEKYNSWRVMELRFDPKYMLN